MSTSVFKAQARRLRAHLKSQGFDLKPTKCLDAIAAVHGSRDWNTLKVKNVPGETGYESPDYSVMYVKRVDHKGPSDINAVHQVVGSLSEFTAALVNGISPYIENGSSVIILCPDSQKFGGADLALMSQLKTKHPLLGNIRASHLSADLIRQTIRGRPDLCSLSPLNWDTRLAEASQALQDVLLKPSVDPDERLPVVVSFAQEGRQPQLVATLFRSDSKTGAWHSLKVSVRHPESGVTDVRTWTAPRLLPVLNGWHSDKKPFHIQYGASVTIGSTRPPASSQRSLNLRNTPEENGYVFSATSEAHLYEMLLSLLEPSKQAEQHFVEAKMLLQFLTPALFTKVRACRDALQGVYRILSFPSSLEDAWKAAVGDVIFSEQHPVAVLFMAPDKTGRTVNWKHVETLLRPLLLALATLAPPAQETKATSQSPLAGLLTHCQCPNALHIDTTAPAIASYATRMHANVLFADFLYRWQSLRAIRPLAMTFLLEGNPPLREIYSKLEMTLDDSDICLAQASSLT